MLFFIPIITTLISGVSAAGAAVAGTAAAAGAAVAGTATAAGAAVVGTVGTTGLAAGGLAATGYAIHSMHEDEVNEARREGFRRGEKQGNLEAARKFEQRFKEFLEKSDANKIATWALGVHVANLDGIEDEELAVIYKKIGDPNSNLVSPYLRNQYMAIYEKTPRFGEIRAKYLDAVETAFLVELNEYVNQIVLSDQVLSDEEKDFLEYEWYPYLQSRGIGSGEPSQSSSGGSASYDSSFNEFYAMDEWQNQQKAVPNNRMSNKTPNPEAERLYNMGISYIEGTGGMPKNKDMAIYCLKQAAELGSEEAKRYLRNLGYQYF